MQSSAERAIRGDQSQRREFSVEPDPSPVLFRFPLLTICVMRTHIHRCKTIASSPRLSIEHTPPPRHEATTATTSTSSSTRRRPTTLASAAAAPSVSLADKARGYYDRSKAMAKQLYSGTKVFIAETRQAKDLKRRKVVDGLVWNRREYFLVKRNEQDFWKAIPFLFCCVFLGEAIPFLLLRGIVPSPCLTPDQVDAKIKRLEGLRKELSDAAVKSVDEGQSQAVGEKNVRGAFDLPAVFCEPGEIDTHVVFSVPAQKKQQLKASSFLKDETILHLAATQPQYFSLENMSSAQLRATNKYLGIWRFGPGIYLRRVLRMHVEYIKGDDM
ncbi:hypothetical protein HKX48_007729, partial [Thoreauomyces humboldtii]